MSSRKEQFEHRERQILATAEQLLLESGDYDLTLDSLARHLDLAKGTLYKHFMGKDELLLRLLIEYEKCLYEMNTIDDGAGAGVARIVLQLLLCPQRATMFHHLEDKLSSTASGLNRLFGELYQIRRERMKRIYKIAKRYLSEQNSTMATRDFLASVWALGQGGAGLLNSSFYQRYLGDRDALKYVFVVQMLDLPKLYTQDITKDTVKDTNKDATVKPSSLQIDDEMDIAPTIDKQAPAIKPKLIKPLTPPLV